MDRFDAMQLFVRIVERRSFTAAAHDIGVPRSTATQVVKQMESRLGVQLLQRTTRVVRPTLDGEAYYRRCLEILSDVEDADGAFGGASPKGLLRVEAQGTLARFYLMPGLPDFFAKYPEIRMSICERDRVVDLVEEGVDCALRWGALPDSDIVARQLGMGERITCASPDYIARFGHPHTLQALEGHQIVGIRSLNSGAIKPFEFTTDGNIRCISLPSPLSVTGTESRLAGIRLGLGLAQMPRFHVEDDLLRGSLVAVLTNFPPPPVQVSVLYPQSRQLSSRVRVFIDWMAAAFRNERFM